MALQSVDGQTSRHDIREQRFSNGTLGDSLMTPRSIPSSSLNTLIDDQDSRITYGVFGALGGTGSIILLDNRAGSFDFGGTSTNWSQQYTGCVFKFSGTTIGVMAHTGPQMSDLDIYIDGVLTPGRILRTYQLLNSATDSVNGYSPTAPLNSTATKVYLQTSSDLDAAGSILIDNELISYQSFSSNSAGGFVLNGCTRGAGGSRAVQHSWAVPAYKWSSNAVLNYGVSVLTYSQKNLVYFNPFLSPGEHTISVVLNNRSGMPITQVVFDGFLVGSLVGADNIYTSIGTASLSGTTDGNGFVDYGILATNSKVTIVGVIGSHQITPDALGAGTMGKLGVRVDGNSNITFYIADGPGSSAITTQIWFMYIGESVYV